MFYLLLIFSLPLVWAQGTCLAPGQSFMEGKLVESFKLKEAQAELKEVVTDPLNYDLREEVKSYQRRLIDAKRLDRESLLTEINSRFDQMIDKTGRSDALINFPVEGAQAHVTPSEDNSIMISMSNLSKEELNFLPPEVLKKLGTKVKVRYYYPIDHFEYEITYDGVDLPMKKAFQKMQDDFETACDARAEENYEIREAKKLDWVKRKYTLPVKPSGTGSAGSR